MVALKLHAGMRVAHSRRDVGGGDAAVDEEIRAGDDTTIRPTPGTAPPVRSPVASPKRPIGMCTRRRCFFCVGVQEFHQQLGVAAARGRAR